MANSVNISDITRYESYKDSGVKWLDDLPSHWEIKRIKYLFAEINERSFDGSEDLLSVSQYTGVTNKSERIEDGAMLTNAATLEGYKKVWEGDLVSNIMLAWNGSLGFSPYNGITSPAYSIYRLKTKAVNKYFHYLFRTELYKSEFKRNSSGVIESRLRLYTDDFFRIWSILPPLPEQTAIAEFLDLKTALIDQAIEIKQKQIELLKERRQILIHKAVTRGLNPNAKMKDSGVDWIGEIPEHWEVKRLKYFVKIQGGFAFDSSHFKDEGIQIIKIANTYMNELSLNRQPTFVDKTFLKTHKDWVVSKGDILMSLTGTMGKKDYGYAILIESNVKFLLNQRVAKITVNKGVEPDYILNILRSEMYLNQLYMLPSGTKQANLSNDNVLNVKVGYPSNRNERQEILTYILASNEKIATAISLKEQEIDKLKEYKATLINSAVTGKIKVYNDAE
jgi:type I restriction enzyme S subunit